MPSNQDTAESRQPLDLSGPFITDVNGSSAQQFRAGQQVVIEQTITNNLYSAETPMVMLTEVRDVEGVTIYLAFQTARVAFNDTNTVGVSWALPVDSPQGSTYNVRIWAITGFERPDALTSVHDGYITLA